jgi:hypothetical protein
LFVFGLKDSRRCNKSPWLKYGRTRTGWVLYNSFKKNSQEEVYKVTLPLGAPFTPKPLLQSQTLLSTK